MTNKIYKKRLTLPKNNIIIKIKKEEKMQIDIKHYMEIFWANPKLGVESSLNRVLEREPLLFDNNCNKKIIQSFRFFDIAEVTLDDGEILVGKRKNFSPMYYNGKRVTLNDATMLGAVGSFIKKEMTENSVESAILCNSGNIITTPEEGSITIEEYKKELLENENNNRKQKIKK